MAETTAITLSKMALFWVARRWQQQHSEELSDHPVNAHADTCRERLTAIMNKALRRKDGTATPHLGQPHPGWFVLGLPLSQHAVGLSMHAACCSVLA